MLQGIVEMDLYLGWNGVPLKTSPGVCGQACGGTSRAVVRKKFMNMKHTLHKRGKRNEQMPRFASH